jgi:uncharacterized protein with von Willebrand factor type A (vWA) domain
MEINTRSKKKVETVINPEGSVVLKRDDRIQLYLEASNLDIKKDKFYQPSEDKLNSIIVKAKAANIEYVRGLAAFLTDTGLKLSPVVLYSTLADRGYSFAKCSLVKTFNTPQRIAEAIGLANSKKIHLNNSFKRKLREALETFSPFTLRKNKMCRRKIKTKDLIKLLRPKPATDEMSKLYKAIIEDTKECKMQETDTFTRVKSSTTLKNDLKEKYFVDNIEKMPLNELIRNLRFTVDKFGFKVTNEVCEKVIKRLNSLGKEDMRFLNIFHLIDVAIHVPQLEKAMLEIVNNYVSKIKVETAMDFGPATILFDVSGSMQGEGINKGLKYAGILSRVYSPCKIRLFANNLYSEDKRLNKALTVWDMASVSNRLDNTPSGGTALIDSTEALLEEDASIKTLVIISDECSWREGSDIVDRIHSLKTKLCNIKVVLINPVVYEGTVIETNTVALSSLSSKILFDLAILKDKDKFIKYIERCDR